MTLRKVILTAACALATMSMQAWEGMAMPKLHIEGRYLTDQDGNHITLHGFGQTYSPWFNEQGKGWGWSYNTADCLKYNKAKIDGIMKAGWKVNWLRLHMDPYWSNDPEFNNNHPNNKLTGENDIRAFSMTRFQKYFEEVFMPMANYAKGKGLYVVMRPPGVCPQTIKKGDDYYNYLVKVWTYVAKYMVNKGIEDIMFELANEPITVEDGPTDFFQGVVDAIRAIGCKNILWVPGTGYQSDYRAYATNPIKGDNIGYAVHAYPGWYGSDAEVESAEQTGDVSGGGYKGFLMGWYEKVGCIAQSAPILLTEMDWAPKKYNSSWGKSVTGTAGGSGFGANLKKLIDATGNVSWMLFTDANLLEQYTDATANGNTFLTDPEACVRPIYRWFAQYAQQWPSDGTPESPTLNDLLEAYAPKDPSKFFPLTNEGLNPNIWETGTFDETTGTLKTGKWGFGGWQYALDGIDLSPYRYLIIELNEVQNTAASFRLFDEQSYWSKPAMIDLGNATRKVVDLTTLKKDGTTTSLDLSHIYIAGFWTNGSGTISIKNVMVSNDANATGIDHAISKPMQEKTSSNVYNLWGQRVGLQTSKLPSGLYIIGGKKVAVR